jgi:hypothetical protein
MSARMAPDECANSGQSAEQIAQGSWEDNQHSLRPFAHGAQDRSTA